MKDVIPLKQNKFLTLPNGQKLPYGESLDENGYIYAVSMEWKNRGGLIFICESGTHVEWNDADGKIVVTNLKPERLFGRMKSLTEEQLLKVIVRLAGSDFEGRTYTP
jgi:hypothetical protein